MKKLVSLLLSALLALALTSCGASPAVSEQPPAAASNAQAPAATPEPAQLSVFYVEDGPTIHKDLLYFQLVKEATNITINPIVVPKTESVEKYNLLISSRDIPDVTSFNNGLGTSPIDKYGPEGAYLNIDDSVLAKTPNYHIWLEKYKDDFAYEKVTSPDGNMYAFAIFFFHNNGGNHLVVRDDIMTKHGLAYPETFDEYYDLLTKLKEFYPDSYPLTSPDGANITTRMDAMFGAYDGTDLKTGTILQDRRLTQNYLDMLNFLKKAYKNQLLDPDFPSVTRDTFMGNMINGVNLGYAGYASWADNINVEVAKTNPNSDYYLKAFLHPEHNGERYKINFTDVIYGGRWAVSGLLNSSQQDVALRYIDYLYSDAGIENTIYGKEGITFNKADGKYVFTEDIITNRREGGTVFIGDEYAVRRHGFYGVYPFVEDFVGPNVGDIGLMLSEMDLVRTITPPYTIPEDDSKVINDIMTAVNTMFSEDTLKYIMTDMTENEWKATVQKVRDMGIDKVREIRQKYYDAAYN